MQVSYPKVPIVCCTMLSDRGMGVQVSFEEEEEEEEQ